MILKNTSKTCTIVLNTVVGKIAVKPGEVVDIKHKIYPPIFKDIVNVSEQEYLEYKKSKKELNEIFTTNDTIDTSSDTTDENTIEEFTNSILGTEEKSEDKPKETAKESKEKKTEISEALKVKETQINDESLKLEEKIKDLEETWLSETNPKQKEKITKEIKKVRKQLEKLNKAK